MVILIYYDEFIALVCGTKMEIQNYSYIAKQTYFLWLFIKRPLKRYFHDTSKN